MFSLFLTFNRYFQVQEYQNRTQHEKHTPGALSLDVFARWEARTAPGVSWGSPGVPRVSPGSPGVPWGSPGIPLGFIWGPLGFPWGPWVPWGAQGAEN